MKMGEYTALGKVNPIDTLTRQVKIEDAEYSRYVKQMDQELVDAVRIPVNATDEDVHRRLDQLSSKQEFQEKKSNVQKQILTKTREEQNAVLAVSESRIIVDDHFKQRIMQVLRTEEPYDKMIQTLEDPTQPNEVQVNEKVYRLKNGTLKVHEKEQKATATYWRAVIPNEVELKLMIVRELHCVPYSGHPCFTRTLDIVKQFFYWKHMSLDVRDFVWIVLYVR